MLQALRECNVQLNDAAQALFADCRFTTLKQPQVVELALVSVADLGLPDGATYEQLIHRALDSGLVECPLELGPRLRVQFLNQPEAAAEVPERRHRAPHGSITVASSPLDELDETPKGFYLRRMDGVLWLRGYFSWSGHVWSPDDVFAFSRRSGSSAAEPSDGAESR